MASGEDFKKWVHSKRAPSLVKMSFVAIAALSILSWTIIIIEGDTGFTDLFDSKTWGNASRFIANMAGIHDSTTPSFLILDRWLATGVLAYETLLMSILAIFISGFIALATMLPAARNVSSGELGGIKSTTGTIAYYIVRLVYAFSRAVPELIWALLIVFFLSPGVLAGALALAFHNFGIIGRLTAEVVENIDPAPARALRTAGASNVQIFFYGVLPQTLPQFLTYSLYRWEVVIRTTVIIGFVSAGGLGREFILRLNWFHYTDVTLLILWYLILVLCVDMISFWLRKLSKFS